jgi:hypothetical protein
MVTALLANARPLCMRSTAISTGAFGPAAQANTVCTVLTDLPPAFGSSPTSAAMIVWPSSWLPKITPGPVPR